MPTQHRTLNSISWNFLNDFFFILKCTTHQYTYQVLTVLRFFVYFFFFLFYDENLLNFECFKALRAIKSQTKPARKKNRIVLQWNISSINIRSKVKEKKKYRAHEKWWSEQIHRNSWRACDWVCVSSKPTKWKKKKMTEPTSW